MKKYFIQRFLFSFFYQGKLLKVMKITLLFTVLSTCFLSAASSFSQNAKVSICVKNAFAKEILHEIKKQTGYSFLYNNDEFNENNQVSINVKNVTIDKVLDIALKNQNLEYEVDNHTIIIFKSQRANKEEYSQSKRIVTGVITEAGTNEPLVGVSVIEKGTNNATSSDMDGKYSIRVSSDKAVLVLSYIGYNTKQVEVGSQSLINVSLEVSNKLLDEVVVIGYGTVKRVNLGGAVSTTDAQTFQSRPVANATSALQGEVPGLTIIRSGGEPGNKPTVRIRDISSINGGSPLILIDGAEGDLSSINSADIENVSVLKDGTAAIYGARAADGVILITTKNPSKNQKLKISFDAYYAMKKPALLKKPANLYEHAVMGLEITDGSFPIEYTKDELQLIAEGSDKVLPTSNWGRWSGYPKFYKDQDWNKMIIGNGNLQNYNVNFTGGGEKYSYFLSLGYQQEEGLPKFGIDNNKRYFVRAKSNIQVLKNLDYDLNLSYEASSRNYSSAISEGQNIWELIYKTRSWAPMYNPAGNFYTFEGFDNPAQVLEDGGGTNLTTGNFTFNTALTWKIMDGLNLIGRAVVRKEDADKYCVMKMLYSYNWDNVNHRVARKPNSAERDYTKNLSKNFTLYAEYKKTFGLHDVGLMVGTANESNDYDKFWAKRINFDQQESMPLGLGSPEDQEASGEGNAWTINSYFSRLNYGFANKYLIEGTLRADGSSRFDPDKRWGYFPGVNLVWRAGEENFIKKLNLFDDLKLRTSYGEMGNQTGIGPYDYIELINISRSYYPFANGQRGQMAQQSNLVSLSRTWETIVSKNVGVDISVLNNRLYGSFDYFWKNNNNMLISVAYPAALGIAPPTTNDGKLEIRGWEIALGWRDRIGDLSYSLRATLSDAKNKVTDVGGGSLISLGNNRTPEGYPMDSYFGYVFDGIIQNETELAEYKSRFPKYGIIQSEVKVGDAKYKDLDGDGNLTVLGDGKKGSGDVVYLGNTNPRYNFGINLNAEYKNFDLGAFFQGVGKRTMFLEGEASMPFYAPWYQSAEYWYGKTWTTERTDARYPAITNSNKKYYNYAVSTNTKHNVAYIRLKNLQFGYTLPKQLTQGVKLEKVRFYFSGEDLFEIHNAPGGWDPEDGGSYVSYPFARFYSLGVNVIF